MNINSYVAIASDYARNYLFYAAVSIPILPYFSTAHHSFLVSSASLPASNIEEMTTDWQGMTYKLGATQTFEDYTLTFKCDDAQILRSQFVTWTNLIHNPATNLHGIPRTYMGKVGLTQINPQNIPIMSYDLLYAWPKTVGEITLEHSSKEISTFDVTFSYLYHISDPIATGAKWMAALG